MSPLKKTCFTSSANPLLMAAAWLNHKERLFRSRVMWLGLLVLPLSCGLVMAVAYPDHLTPKPTSSISNIGQKGLTQKSQSAAMDRVTDDTAMPADVQRFALNAFLATLIDDSIPSRWSDAALDLMCDPGTTVLVNNKPMVAGDLVPAVAFHLRWDMDHCELLGHATQFSGGVELFVFHEGSGMGAIVVPDRLVVYDSTGRSVVRDTFTAEMSMTTSMTEH